MIRTRSQNIVFIPPALSCTVELSVAVSTMVWGEWEKELLWCMSLFPLSQLSQNEFALIFLFQ